MTDNDSQRMDPVEARSRAQKLAFAPFAFHAAVALRDTGLLAATETGSKRGKTLAELAEETGLSRYATSVLLDFGSNLGLVSEAESGERFLLGPVGEFILHDEMTRVNLNFTRDVCYQALPHLEESLRHNEPMGLKEFGSWDTLYDGLEDFPEPAMSSWYAFNHFYSDQAFEDLLGIVFERSVDHLTDVGGNTGRWARQCLEYDPDVTVTVMDLPEQIEQARANLNPEYGDRIQFQATDLRDDSVWFPEHTDVLWMCQLLDCFSKEDIVRILHCARESMDRDTLLYIVELFPDRQDFEAATFCLNALSLYFTCVANGESRMYRYDRFKRFVREAGLTIEETIDFPASHHTVLVCAL